jgi:hypothetical protein
MPWRSIRAICFADNAAAIVDRVSQATRAWNVFAHVGVSGAGTDHLDMTFRKSLDIGG